MKILGLRLNQVAFLLSAFLLLLSLPWLAVWGAWLWVGAKIIFLFGVVFVLWNR
jgi:hypothetical protein